MAPLVRSGDVARLVLDPKIADKAERSGERRLARHRRDPEAAPVDGLQAEVQLADQVAPSGVGKADRARKPVRRQPLPIAQERVVFTTRGTVSRLDRGDQHMVDFVSGAGVGTGERKGARRIDCGAAAVADERWRRVGEAHDSLAAAPLSALNFVIIASHAGARSSRPSQNA